MFNQMYEYYNTVNKAAYQAWEDKKTPLEVKKFKFEKILMFI